jgi:hypothetical protein
LAPPAFARREARVKAAALKHEVHKRAGSAYEQAGYGSASQQAAAPACRAEVNEGGSAQHEGGRKHPEVHALRVAARQIPAEFSTKA